MGEKSILSLNPFGSGLTTGIWGRAKRGTVSREELSQSRYGSAQYWDDELLEAIMWSVVDLVAFAEVAYSDCDFGHLIVSGKW